MKGKSVVVPVNVTNVKKTYRKSSGLEDKNRLEVKLKRLGLNIFLKDSLKGGTISQVYRATFNGNHVVVKHTEDLKPFDPTELYLPRESHLVDAKVRDLLQKSVTVRVPRKIKELPEIKTSIMEDLNEEGYTLLSDKILNSLLNLKSANKIGQMLAHLAKESRHWESIIEVQTKEMSIYERGLELRLAYPNSQSQYLELENLFIENAKYWSWPDAHPKNILVREDGNCAFIDFGFSQKGDQRFMIATFLAHIVIYNLAGYIKLNLASSYIQECMEGYKSVEEKFDEDIFCKYLAMEILHRANGKWITGIDTAEQKTMCNLFGLKVFNNGINTFDNLSKLLNSICISNSISMIY